MSDFTQGVGSKIAIIGGILTIAVADAFSDALGIHVSEESENKHSKGEIWKATLATFLSKFVFSLTFIIPVLLFSLSTAVIISVLWGLFLITVFSFYLAREQGESSWKVVGEHLIISLVVIAATNFLGHWIASIFS